MSALILAFPIVQRRGAIRRLADQMIARPPGQAEKHLQFQLRRQAKSLRTKQIREDEIAAQVSAFEAAVRAQLWRQVLTPDGVA